MLSPQNPFLFLVILSHKFSNRCEKSAEADSEND